MCCTHSVQSKLVGSSQPVSPTMACHTLLLMQLLIVLVVVCLRCTAAQTEDFYNFADENGLLIWQDAMFGGSHYPRTPQWLENYAEEISQQVCATPCNQCAGCAWRQAQQVQRQAQQAIPAQGLLESSHIITNLRQR